MKTKTIYTFCSLILLCTSFCIIGCRKTTVDDNLPQHDFDAVIYYLPYTQYVLFIQNPSREALVNSSAYQFAFSYNANTKETNFMIDSDKVFETMDPNNRGECFNLLYREIKGIPYALKTIESVELKEVFFTDGVPLTLWTEEDGNDLFITIKAVAFMETPLNETRYSFDKYTAAELCNWMRQ